MVPAGLDASDADLISSSSSSSSSSSGMVHEDTIEAERSDARDDDDPVDDDDDDDTVDMVDTGDIVLARGAVGDGARGGAAVQEVQPRRA